MSDNILSSFSTNPGSLNVELLDAKTRLVEAYHKLKEKDEQIRALKADNAELRMVIREARSLMSGVLTDE